MPPRRAPRRTPLLAALLTPDLACAVVDPDAAPALVPTLVLACEHPDAWFEGIYPAVQPAVLPTVLPAVLPAADPGSAAYPAAAPHRPGPLRTELARAELDGPRGSAAQTACADVCVGLAEPGFYYRCPDQGWHIEAELTLAPARVPGLPGADACYPDSPCAAAFAAPIGHHLRAPAAAAEPGRRQADHLGVLADAELELALAGARVHHPLHGLAEYSAGACEAAPCYFYLANLQLGDHDARSRAGLRLDAHRIPAGLRGLRVDLMQPALGEFTPETGALRFPVGALDLRLRLDIRAGARLEPGERELRLRNPVEVHGRYLAGALELDAEIPLAALGSARLALDFRPRAHPPAARFDPPLRLRGGPDGLPLPGDPAIPSPLHAADDPDGDLRALHWVVDGVPGARSIPPGEHEVELWAVDARGAVDRSPTRTVLVAGL